MKNYIVNNLLINIISESSMTLELMNPMYELSEKLLHLRPHLYPKVTAQFYIQPTRKCGHFSSPPKKNVNVIKQKSQSQKISEISAFVKNLKLHLVLGEPKISENFQVDPLSKGGLHRHPGDRLHELSRIVRSNFKCTKKFWTTALTVKF